MVIYVDVVFLLNFLVDLFLLAGTNRLAGYRPDWGRCALSAAVGGLYAVCCLFPGLHFLGNLLWRTASLAAMAALAFGTDRSVLRRGVLFLLLSMALGGLATAVCRGGFWGLILCAAGLFVLCRLGFQRNAASSYVGVTILCRGKTYRLTALRDTGNTLCDPVTGSPVLIVGANIAWDMLGLTVQDLNDPVSTLACGSCPGLRLLPYRAVGMSNGMLLAMKMDKVVLDGRESGNIVAFAPNDLSVENTYQALAGGVL